MAPTRQLPDFKAEPGDRLLVYTDGMAEAENSQREALGEVRLGEFIAAYQDLPGEEFAERLLHKVLAWPENVNTIMVIDIARFPSVS